ncbi:hypothetical protein AB685_26520 [Bacillus sp. LL01]|uniref:IclR family transcriptional regulator n=1 Tax=Bacillus sp. LL01 TaxID=1665556 RepID=UPI00064D0CE3|nr:IclR family transcriptional regulator [Bacillus sp. LL01]KMJ55576.1 hypothetical protein AB685_26520 [Bacillus sp. LL01]
MTKKIDTVQSVERAIDLLYCFSINEPELSINDLVEKTGLKRPTVFRLLTSMKEKNLIVRDENTGVYKLGLPFIGFGQIVSETIDVRKEAVPILKALSKQTNETVSLNIIQERRRVCVEKVDGMGDIRQFVRLGYPYPLVRGASGQIFLAYSDQEFIEQVLTEWKENNGDEVNRAKYFDNLMKIKKDGIATSKNDRAFGAYSISAPVFNVTGQMIAGLSMSGLAARLTDEMEKEFKDLVVKSALHLSQKLGFNNEH